MPEVTPAVPYALGTVLSRSNQIVTVQFADIEANPLSVRNTMRQFKLDLGKTDYRAGDWVVASWKRAPRTDKATGALLVQGSVGSGCDLRPVTKAVSPGVQAAVFTPFTQAPTNASLRSLPGSAGDAGVQTFLKQAAHQLSSQLEQRTAVRQDKLPGPDPSGFLSVVDPRIPDTTSGPPPPWLPVPVPAFASEQEWSMPDSYIRIGYVGFTVDSPVEEIRIEEKTPTQSVQTLRSRTPIQKNNWYTDRQVTITLTLHGLEAINEILLPLVRLFKKAPFLPVFNHLLYDADITALTLQSLQTSTIPGYPNALKAVLVCWAFNWQTYLPLAQEAHGLDALFCYPLLKIWAERPHPQMIAPQKLLTPWDGQFHMYQPSESWLQQVNEFPSSAAKTRRLTDDLAALRLATLWAGDATADDQAGFKQSRAFPTALGGRTQIVTLDGNAGRSVLEDGPYTFLRITDEALARQVASSPDCVRVLKGAVNLANSSAKGGVLGAVAKVSPVSVFSPPSLVNTEAILGGPGSLISLLDQGDRATLDALQAGHYTFQIRMHSPLFQSLVRQRQPAQAVQPPDEPVADENTEFTPPSLVIEQISCAMDNIIAQLQVRGKTHPTHQYLGSNCLSFQVVGTLQNYEDLSQIQHFLERVQEFSRDYRGTIDGKPFGGFCIVENELFRLMGVRHVIPIAWEATTVPDFPGALRVSITLVEFDITQRRIEGLDNLTQGFETNPITSIRSEHDPISAYYVRQAFLNQRLRTVELYPDLGLPLHSELAQWIKDIQEDRVWDWQNHQARRNYEYLDPENGGSGWQWSQSEHRNADGVKIADRLPDAFMAMRFPVTRPDRFADPDFYCAPAQSWGVELVEGVINGTKAHPVVLSDSYGTQVEIRPGEHLNEDLVRRKGKDPQNTLADGQKAVDEGTHPPAVGASAGLVDAVLWGQISGMTPADEQTQALEQAGQKIKSGRALLIPSVPAQSDVKNGGTRPTVAVDDSGTKADRYNRYAPIAAAAAQAYDLPKDLFFAQIDLESGWKATAVDSVVGTHKGLGQLGPEAQQRFGVTNPFDPAQNLFAAARYMSILRKLFGGDMNKALAAYNQGEGAILRGGATAAQAGAQYVAQVQARVPLYISTPNAPTGLGNTAGWLAQPEADPLIQVQKRQLIQQFNNGLAYQGAEIQPLLKGSPYGDPAQQFIDPAWVTPIGEMTASESIDPLSRALNAKGIQIKAPFLGEFLAECKRRHLQLSIITDPAPIQPVDGLHHYDSGYDDPAYDPPTIQQTFFDPQGKHDIWHDLREELICGRLLGAFPTFYVALIDGGRRMRIYRIFDHLYGMQAVTRIAVHRTRKGPIETAVVNFSNMYGHLTAQGNDQSRFNSRDTRTTWGLEAVWRGLQGFVKITDETLVEWAEAVETLLMKPGARLHIRMGYGSDCSMLPVVFNGVISEVPISEGEVQVVALSDGVELTNDLAPTNLQGSMPVTRLTSLFGEGMNPREIVTTFMAPNPTLATLGNFVGTSLAFGNTPLQELFYGKTPNAYGIEHFGSPIRSGRVGFDDGEIGVNLYNPESSAPYTNSSAWDNTLRIFQAWRWDKNKGLIGINMAQATPWQIFETCRKSVPDYLLYAAPFEVRSTLFFGKAWFPLFYRYKESVDISDPQALFTSRREDLMDWKPFQQTHIVTSDWNLLWSDVRADSTDMATQVQAIGTYNGWLPGSNDMSNEASFVMMLDSDIWQECQKLKVVESGLYADVNMKLGDANSDEGGGARVTLGAILTALGIATANPALAIGGLSQLAEGPVRSFFFSRRVEDFFAAATLKDYVKDMYQGPIVMLGNPYIKPYDMLSVADSLVGLHGMAEAKTVTHTMALDSGFVTVVEPDCVAHFMDVEGRDLSMWADMATSHLLAAVGMSAVLGTLARRGSKAAILRGVRRLSKWVDSEVLRIAGGLTPKSELFQKLQPDQAFEAAEDMKSLVDEVTQGVQAGNTARLRDLLRGLTDQQGAARTAASAGGATLREILDAAPNDIQFEIHVQNALRGGLLETQAGKYTLEKASQFSTLIKNKAGDVTLRNAEELDRLTTELEQKHADLAALGRSDEELRGLARSLKKGESLTQADKNAAELFNEVAGLEKRWKVQSFARQTIATTIPEGTELLASLGKSIFSASTAGAWITGIGSILMGCLSDYITRVMVARQCLTIYPLKLYGKNLEAGINGHRGSVAGDRLGNLDEFIQRTIEFVGGTPGLNLIAPFIPILGDIVTSGINYRAPTVPSFIDSDTRALGGG